MFKSFTILLAALSALASRLACAGNIDSLLQAQRLRGGIYIAELFQPLNDTAAFKLSDVEREDYRFLLASLPLTDIATLTAQDLIDNLKSARQAAEVFAWGAEIPPAVFRHFVLPHRISQEPFTYWRRDFLAQIAPRVKDLSMSEAVLEINHWCHERATYKPTDGRDQDPLTTLRSGFGRCEEEMILTIAALRSVGIPARQCYTPYWAHCDDNHAWVEVWADGKWHYLGACEPAQALNQAWFTNPAQRAMLVVSSAYGDYQGDEPVLRSYGRSTNINSTAVYGQTRQVDIQIIDQRGKPAAKRRVIFNLFNYGGWMPIAGRLTDVGGKVELTCGNGDFLLTCGDMKQVAIAHSTPRQIVSEICLQKVKNFEWPEAVEYNPPPMPEISAPQTGLYSLEGEVRGVIDSSAMLRADSLFKMRINAANERRKYYTWVYWQREARGAECEARSVEFDSTIFIPDTALVEWAVELHDGDSTQIREIIDILNKGYGNWGVLYKFLFKLWPDEMMNCRESHRNEPASLLYEENLDPLPIFSNRLILLKTLSDKDLRDFNLEVLDDHFNWTTLSLNLGDLLMTVYIDSLDSLNRKHWTDYVVCPRIDYEPSIAWRKELVEFYATKKELLQLKTDKQLRRWLKKNIKVEDNPDRLGPPLTPAQCLRLKNGTRRDIERLYVGLSRVLGIAARFNPVAGGLERWDGANWLPVDLWDAKKTSRTVKTAKLHLVSVENDSLTNEAQYLRDWCLARWENDLFDAVDLGYHKPFKDIAFPVELPPGRYCLTSGKRRPDGSADVKMQWLDLVKGKLTEAKILVR